jgi:hypothetical protein
VSDGEGEGDGVGEGVGDTEVSVFRVGGGVFFRQPVAGMNATMTAIATISRMCLDFFITNPSTIVNVCFRSLPRLRLMVKVHRGLTIVLHFLLLASIIPPPNSRHISKL